MNGSRENQPSLSAQNVKAHIGTSREKLTQKRLKEFLDYDPVTGWLSWKVSKGGRAQKGSRAGSKDPNGYLVCRVDGKQYKAHRLVWLYVHGYMPENALDHINKSKTDNRIENLREASVQCNARNAKQTTGTTSGVKGISWDNRSKKWLAGISTGERRCFLGYYKSKHNAACARLAAEQCLGWAGCDSNSPAYQYVKNMIRAARPLCTNGFPESQSHLATSRRQVMVSKCKIPERLFMRLK